MLRFWHAPSLQYSGAVVSNHPLEQQVSYLCSCGLGQERGRDVVNDVLPDVVRRGFSFWWTARPPQQTQKLPFDFSLCLVVCSVSKQLVRPRSNTSSRGSGCDTYRLRLGLLSNTVVSLGTRASRRADCNETTSMYTKLQKSEQLLSRRCVIFRVVSVA